MSTPLARVGGRVAAIVVLGLLLAGSMKVYGPDLAWVVAVIEGLRGAGPKGQALFAIGYALATVVMVPASWLMGASGFLYGPIWGTLAASALSTGSGAVSFLLARTVLRSRLEARMASPRLAALDRAVADGGLVLVILLRLPPVSPYNVVNYALGLTGVRFRDYLLGTFLGGLVPIILWSYIGSTVADLAQLMAGEVEGPVWVRWVGLAVTVTATLAVTRFAKRAVDRALDDQSVGPS